MTDIQILKRLFNDYTKKYFKKILVSVLFSFILAGSTSAVAYLLDPAIKHLFINKQQSLMLIIPFFIILAFSVKGLSLYIAKVIMIGVSEEVRKDIQTGSWQYLEFKKESTAFRSEIVGEFRLAA